MDIKKDLIEKINNAEKALNQIDASIFKEDIEDEKEDIKLGECIAYEDYGKKVNEMIGVITPIVDQCRANKTIKDLVKEALLIGPEDMKSMGITKINQYLIMIPKSIIYYQDCYNKAVNELMAAEYKYDDTIVNPSYNISKEAFGKITTVSEKMRIAKMSELFPEKYKELVAEVRKWKNVVNSMEGQVKHLQTFNDNLKRIRDSYIKETTSRE